MGMGTGLMLVFFSRTTLTLVTGRARVKRQPPARIIGAAGAHLLAARLTAEGPDDCTWRILALDRRKSGRWSGFAF
jgi:hypothetical protein